MRAYWAIISARFRTLLQYRVAAVAGLGTQLFWGLIRVMIFAAFYRSTKSSQPMTYPEVVTYIWLGQALFAMLPWSIDGDIRAMMRTGTVAYELLRPMDLYWTWYCRAIAMRIAPTLLRAIPLVVIAMPFLGMRPPASAGSGLAWAAATVGALAVGCAITNLISVSLFWTISGEGVSRLIPVAVWMFSGSVIPLPLLPGWAQSALYALPFRDLVDTPFRLYLGHIPACDIWFVLARQTMWTIALVTLGRWILARCTRMLVVQGG